MTASANFAAARARLSGLKRYSVFALALCFALGYGRYFFKDSPFGIGSVFHFFILACAHGIIVAGRGAEPAAREYGRVFGYWVSVALIVGRTLYGSRDITWIVTPPVNLVFTLIAAAGFTAVFGAVTALVLTRLPRAEANLDSLRRPSLGSHTGVTFAAIWAFIFICWFPAYLAYYPGMFSYDITAETREALGILPLSRHNPPLHTFLWLLCMRAAQAVGADAMCIYAIAQMLFLSGCFARASLFLLERRVAWPVSAASVLFFALSPPVAIFSFAMTKDVGFAGFLTLATIRLCELASSPGVFLASRRKCVSFALFALAACLLRNNGAIAFALAAPVAAFALREQRGRVLLLFAAPAACFALIFTVVFGMMGAEAIDPRDALNVPMQQIARVVKVCGEELTEEDRGEIEGYFTVEKLAAAYKPSYTYPVRKLFKTYAYEADAAGFWRLWARLLSRYPSEYISAFLSLTLGAWYADAPVYGTTGIKYIETQISKANTGEFLAGERRSVLPAMLEFYESAAAFRLFRNLPFISTLYSNSSPVWVMAFCALALIYRGRRRGVIVLAPAFALWLTHLGGPIYYFRYVFPLFALCPLFIAIALQPGRMLALE